MSDEALQRAREVRDLLGEERRPLDGRDFMTRDWWNSFDGRVPRKTPPPTWDKVEPVLRALAADVERLVVERDNWKTVADARVFVRGRIDELEALVAALREALEEYESAHHEVLWHPSVQSERRWVAAKERAQKLLTPAQAGEEKV